MCNYCFSDDIKHDAATTIAHIKFIITLLKQSNSISNTLSTIWQNIDGSAEHYICATALYLMQILSHVFYVIIDRGIITPRHCREVLDGLNAIDKTFLFQLMSTMKLKGENIYDTQMVMHTGTRTSDVSLAR